MQYTDEHGDQIDGVGVLKYRRQEATELLTQNSMTRRARGNL